MSTVKVNTISTWTGSDISIETGKTVSGTASQFKMTDVVQGDVLYGSAADTLSRLAPGTSGQYLQTAGAAANPVWATVAGGLTTASQWRLTTDFTGDAAPIASNLEEVDAPLGFGVLGSSMTVDAGEFTFPSTGYWRIDYYHMWDPSSEQQATISIYTTTDNSTYALATQAYSNGHYVLCGASCSYIMDVTSTSTHKVRFHVVFNSAAASQTTLGDTAYNETCMTFEKLGDT